MTPMTSLVIFGKFQGPKIHLCEGEFFILSTHRPYTSGGAAISDQAGHIPENSTLLVLKYSSPEV